MRMKNAICPTCEGEGKITNPSIGAITASEWQDEWDPESRENYMSGLYDVACTECKGKRVIKVLDEDSVSPLRYRRLMAIQAYRAQIREECDAMQRAEMRMGA